MRFLTSSDVQKNVSIVMKRMAMVASSRQDRDRLRHRFVVIAWSKAMVRKPPWVAALR
jgi:hypothetical protein